MKIARSAVVSLVIVGAVVACLIDRASADDDDIVNAQGFELPFTTVFLGTGQLEGQINPAGEGQVLPPGQWLRTGAASSSTATVQSTVFAPGGGVQAVRVDRAANSDARWAVNVDHLGYPDYPNPFPPEPAQPFISISWDMRVQQTQGPAGTSGPFFGVEAYDNPGRLGALGVDASTGKILYSAPGTGVLTETGATVNFGEWNHFRILLDYSTDQYSIFHNLAGLGSFAFVDAGLDQFSQADIATLAALTSAESVRLTGTAYFDNFLIREGGGESAGTVPEPTTAVLLAAGFAMAGYARRRARRLKTVQRS
jgi:hypothetical protein